MEDRKGKEGRITIELKKREWGGKGRDLREEDKPEGGREGRREL